MTRILVIAILLLSACSGGGGSSSDPSPPPGPGGEQPPPTNSPPTISVTLSTSSVSERQPITIDASGSNDVDGDTLTYTLDLGTTTLAPLGPDTDGPTWTIKTTDVDTDTIVNATISVSDGSNTVSEDVTFTILNYDRTPLKNVWAEASETFDIATDGSAKFSENRYYDGFQVVHLLRTNEADQLEAVEFEFTNNSFRAPNVFPLGMAGDQDAWLVAEDVQHGVDHAAFAVLSPTANTIKVFKRHDRATASESGIIIMPDMCSVSWKHIDDARKITERLSLLIGTDNGLWGWLNDGRNIDRRDVSGDFTYGRVMEPNGDYCHPGQRGVYYNPETHEIDSVDAEELYVPDFPLPFAVNAPQDLEIVDVRIGHNDTRKKFFFVLLFAGDAHDDPHQVSIIYETSDGQIEQQDIALPAGIPTDLMVHSIDTNFIDMERGGWGNRDTDIVIAVPETPYIYIIETTSSATDELAFGPVEFFEVGFGVQDIAAIVTDGSNRYSLLTTDGSALSLHKSALEFRRF